MNVTVTLQSVLCYKCGVIFSMPESMVNNLQANHNDFYCPSGHSQKFTGKSPTEKLQEQLDKEIKYRREAVEKLDQIKLRVREMATNICPACGMTRTNLKRHLASKHPKFFERL